MLWLSALRSARRRRSVHVPSQLIEVRPDERTTETSRREEAGTTNSPRRAGASRTVTVARSEARDQSLIAEPPATTSGTDLEGLVARIVHENRTLADVRARGGAPIEVAALRRSIDGLYGQG